MLRWVLLPLLLATANAEMVDRIEVVVEQDLVMTSDITIDGILQDLDDSPSPFWSKRPQKPVDRLADAALIRHLAGELAIYQPSQVQVDQRLDTLTNDHFPTQAAWTKFLDTWGLDQAAVRSLLRRRMVVERYLARNLQHTPVDTPQWWEAYDMLMSPQRARARIRYVEPASDASR